MNEDEFWSHPLGTWLRDCLCPPTPLIAESEWRPLSRTKLQVKYAELCDGVVMSLLFRQIEPNTIDVLVVGPSKELPTSTYRHKQFLSLLNGIRRFYRDRLNQLIVMSLPDIVSIISTRSSDGSAPELNKFLLLLLGCAVQSERKKIFIERIKKLEKPIQEGLARQITRLTESSSCVISLPSLALSTEDHVLSLLEQLMRERDAYATHLVEMALEHESDEGSSTTGTNSLNGDIPPRKTIGYDRRSPSPTMLDRHTNVELASIKAEVRRLRNETEAKEEDINHLQDEIQIREKEILRLQDERLELIRDARAARDLRDELECANQQLEKLEKLEQDNDRLREKVSELDYFKNRVEQLRTESETLEESIAYLEAQLDEHKQKGKTSCETEMRLAESQGTIKGLHAEITAKNKKIEELLSEQTRMEKELAETANLAKDLEKELMGTERTPRNLPDSLFAQMEETDRSEVVQLRLSNQKLKQRVEELEGERENSISITLVQMESKFEESQKLLRDQREENELINKQLNDLELMLSELNQQFKESSEMCTVLQEERDTAQLSLQEARRNFVQFQSDVEKKAVEVDSTNTRKLKADIRELQRKLEKTSEEREEIGKLAEKLKNDQKRLRSELDQMEDEKKSMEQASSQTDRARRAIETERNALKEKIERLEDEIESSRSRLISTDDAQKRLANTEKLLGEVQNKMGDIEQENRSLSQQLELESKKVQSLREDLVFEKSRAADLVSRLRSVCTGISLNGGRIDAEVSDTELINTIDDVIMTALNAARREADTLRIQQHTQIAELTDLKRDIEKLRRAENDSLNESDDRVRQLSQENVNIKEQVYLLQEKLREHQIEVATKTSDAVSARREVEELRNNNVNANKLHNEIATLQVTLKNSQLQEELLKQDNSELRVQVEICEKAKKEAKRDSDSIAALHQVLLSDHDRLQSLHDMLTHDYERAKFEIGEMKKRVRVDKVSPSPISLQEFEDLRSALRNERLNHDRTLKQSAETQNELGQARREWQNVRKENDCLVRNCDELNAEVYKLKLSDQAQKATIKNFNVTIDDLTRRLEAKDVELAKLRNRIEMLTQLNRTLDEESKNLGRQVEMLLNQNKDLLHRALNEKDQYHQESRDFQEKLSNLRRHKEKLEEKIMDQYRSMESKKSRDKGSTLVKRAAKALIPKKSRSSEKASGSTTEDSSVYSADECNARNDEDLVPTCSSSEDADRVSPPRFDSGRAYDPFFIRSRNDIVGGSVRAYSGVRRQTAMMQNIQSMDTMNVSGMQSGNNATTIPHPEAYDHISLHGSERGVDVVSALRPCPSLPPRIPVRNTPLTGSLRSRPPPPPYPSKPKHKPPPPYMQRTSTPNTSIISEFEPQSASTPKSDRSASPRRPDPTKIAKEGEQREFVREKEERFEKALSQYENVHQNDSMTTQTAARNESTVWYEYGCV